MEECYYSFRIGRLYIQKTKSNYFQILFDKSGGAKTLFKIKMGLCHDSY